MAGKSRWEALVVPRDRQMLFFSIQGTPHIWLSLDKAFAELKAAVPLNTAHLLLPFRWPDAKAAVEIKRSYEILSSIVTK